MSKIRVAYITVFVLLISLAVIVVTADDGNESKCFLLSYDFRSCVNTEEIIKKLDWNNCVTMYLASNPYDLPKESNPKIVYDKVEKWCGDRP